VAGIIAVEIFTEDLFGPVGDAATQGLADADALARNTESHVNLAWLGSCLRMICSENRRTLFWIMRAHGSVTMGD
jgi:hypothetical protein